MINKNDPFYKDMLTLYEEWEIEEMLENQEPEEEFFDPEKEYGIPIRGEF